MVNRDPISTSELGAHDFDCDKAMPEFKDGLPPYHARRASDGDILQVDWFSAKHHVLTIGYCFFVTHVGYMGVIREWASRHSFSANDRTKFFENARQQSCKDKRAVLHARLNTEVVRLNAFMSLAMVEMQRIRTRYRQDDLLCYVPGAREISRLTTGICKPI
jgi:hypothetical protein